MRNIFLIFIVMLILDPLKIANCQMIPIGTQFWDSKNLSVTSFRNGDPILHAKTADEWRKAGESKKPAWCYYNNDSLNDSDYGKLYNFYAVKDIRGLAPQGWHIPSPREWVFLIDTTLDGGYNAARKMKSSVGWKIDSKCNGSNRSGFAGLPGGYRSIGGAFGLFQDFGFWWSNVNSKVFFLSCDFIVDKSSYPEGLGFSVRCIKD